MFVDHCKLLLAEAVGILLGPVTFGLKMLHVPAGNSKKAQALVYFPAGTYMVNSSIIQNYGVSLHGIPNCLPVIKALPTFQNAPGAIGLIDGNLSVSTFTKKLRAWVNVVHIICCDSRKHIFQTAPEFRH